MIELMKTGLVLQLKWMFMKPPLKTVMVNSPIKVCAVEILCQMVECGVVILVL